MYNSIYKRSVQYNASSITFTLDSDTDNLGFNFYTGTGIDHTATCQLERGSTATAYEPYTTTIYGGYVDPINGEIVATWSSVDLGQLGWTINSYEDIYWFRTTSGITGIKRVANTSVVGEFMTDRFKTVAASAIYMGTSGDNAIGEEDQNVSDPRIRIRADSYNNDTTAFKTAMDGVMMYFALEIPIHYQLTPIMLKTLKGANNFWSSGNGTTSVEYWKHDITSIPKMTVTWNQLVENGNFSNGSNGWTCGNDATITASNNIATCSKPSNDNNTVRFVITTSQRLVSTNGHKYLFAVDVKAYDNRQIAIIPTASFGDGSVAYATYPNTTHITWIWNCSVSKSIAYEVRGYTGSSSDNGAITIEVGNVMMIDLTLMYGAGNEPTVAEFEQQCALNHIDLTQYQSYNAGTQMTWRLN